MNIFYFSSDPTECAKMHCNSHCIKMILEYAQILSTAHRVIDGQESVISYDLNGKTHTKKVWTHPDPYINNYLYSATHINHPSTKWAMHSRANYKWLYRLFAALCDEYSYRYGKIHATETKLSGFLSVVPANIDYATPFCSPWRAMPDEYKVSKSVDNYCEKSYHAYFNSEKQHIAVWALREEPIWYIGEEKCYLKQIYHN